MQARTHEQRGQQGNDQCARGNRQPGASLQLGLTLLRLGQLDLQRGVAIELAVDFEAGMQRGHLADTACLVGRGVEAHVFVEIRIGRGNIAERRVGVGTQLEERRDLAGRHVGGAVRQYVVQRGQRPGSVALGKVDLREE